MAGTAVGGLDALLTGAGDVAAQAQAQKYLSALSSYLVTANAALPDQIGGVANTRCGCRRRAGRERHATAGTGAGGTGTAPGRGVAPPDRRRGRGRPGDRPGRRSNSVARVAGPARAGRGRAQPAYRARAPAGLLSGRLCGRSRVSTSTAASTGTVLGCGDRRPRCPVAWPSMWPFPAPPGLPARAASSLQSAAPVPGAAPGAAPSPETPASGTSGAGDLGASAASPLSPVPMAPGLSGSGAAGGAGGGRGGGTAARDGEDPPAAGLLPGIQGAVGDGALPEVAALGNGTAGASPLPELPTPGRRPGRRGFPAAGGGRLTGTPAGASPLPDAAGPPGTSAGASPVAGGAAGVDPWTAGGRVPVADAPGVDGVAAGASPLPEAPGLDGGLNGGATPLPGLPVTAPAMGAVPAGEAAGFVRGGRRCPGDARIRRFARA